MRVPCTFESAGRSYRNALLCSWNLSNHHCVCFVWGFLWLFMGAGSRYSRGDDPGMCDPNSCAGAYHYRPRSAVGICLHCCLMLVM